MAVYTTEHILQTLGNYRRNEGQRHGIVDMALFGSAARSEQREGSDIDVCVRLKKKSFFTRMQIKEELEQLFHLPVDVISMDSIMLPQFKSALQHEAIYI